MEHRRTTVTVKPRKHLYYQVSEKELKDISKDSGGVMWHFFSLFMGSSISVFLTGFFAESQLKEDAGYIAAGLFALALLFLIIALSSKNKRNRIIDEILEHHESKQNNKHIQPSKWSDKK